MRIKSKKTEISYNETQNFFDNRVKKFREDNPYSVTMYQDDNPDLVIARNKAEIEKLIPKLRLDRNSRVLDLACGIGRWSDAITCEIKDYCGLDFCDGLIEIAIDRNKDKENRHFYVSRNEDVAETILKNNEGKFNRILIIGALIYLNDEDVKSTLEGVESLCEKNAIICIREPIGIEARLTLKEQFSDELKDNYNAIYRTKDELIDIFDNTLTNHEFRLVDQDFLFNDNSLNNRKETSQYYFIYRR